MMTFEILSFFLPRLWEILRLHSAATPVSYSGSIRAAWPARDEEEEEAGQ
jgi:hypothetical protein